MPQEELLLEKGMGWGGGENALVNAVMPCVILSESDSFCFCFGTVSENIGITGGFS